MEFVYEKKEGRALYVGLSKVKERFDHEANNHIFYIEETTKTHRDICMISAETGEFEWLPNVSDEIKEDVEVKTILKTFKNATTTINGDMIKLKEWLNQKLKNYDIGPFEEFYIAITASNADSSKIWWSVKRQRSFGPNGIADPVFVVRYEIDERTPEFRAYGEPGTPYDLYISQDYRFNAQEIMDTILCDVSELNEKVYDMTVEHRYRIPPKIEEEGFEV